jgi:hypothetical protein
MSDAAPSVWSIPGYTEESDTEETAYLSPKCNVQFQRIQEDKALVLHALKRYHKYIDFLISLEAERAHPSHHDEMIGNFLRGQLRRAGKLIILQETEIRNLKLFRWERSQG